MNAKNAIAFVKRNPLPVAIGAALVFFIFSKLLMGIALGAGLAWFFFKKKTAAEKNPTR